MGISDILFTNNFVSFLSRIWNQNHIFFQILQVLFLMKVNKLETFMKFTLFIVFNFYLNKYFYITNRSILQTI